MVKNDICLGGASKQDTFFKKYTPKNAAMPKMSRIDPANNTPLQKKLLDQANINF